MWSGKPCLFSYPINGSECSKLFNFDRFFLGNYMCYRLTLKNDTIFDTEMIGNSIESLGVVYKFSMQRRGLLYSRCMFVSFHGSYPYYFRKLIQEITSEIDQDNKLPMSIRHKLYVISLDLRCMIPCVSIHMTTSTLLLMERASLRL